MKQKTIAWIILIIIVVLACNFYGTVQRESFVEVSRGVSIEEAQPEQQALLLQIMEIMPEPEITRQAEEAPTPLQKYGIWIFIILLALITFYKLNKK